jgi:hypothetical protein
LHIIFTWETLKNANPQASTSTNQRIKGESQPPAVFEALQMVPQTEIH